MFKDSRALAGALHHLVKRACRLFVVGMLLLAASLQGGAAQEPASASAPVVVGWTEAPGFSSAAPGGEPVGFFAELAREIAAEAGFEIVFRKFPTSADVIRAQVSGDSQMIAGLDRLPAVARTNVFSDRVATSRVRLFVRAEDGIDGDLSGLEGLRIATVPSSAGSDLSMLGQRNEIVAYDRGLTAQMALLNGVVDGVIARDAPNAYILRIARLDHRIVPVGAELKTIPRFVALHESRGDLLGAVNAAVATLEASGRLEELRQRWLVHQPPPAPPVLTVGLHEFPPYIVLDEGEPTGYSVEVLRELADFAGYELRFRVVTSAEWRAGPGVGPFDLLPMASINDERRARMDFTIPIDSSPLAIFVHPDEAGEIGGLDDLAGRRVGVSRLNVSGEIARKHGGFEVVPYENLGALLQGYVAGEVDALLHMRTAVLERAEIESVSDKLAPAAKPFATADRAIALRPGLGEVRERFNALLPGFLLSEEYGTIRDRWLRAPVFWTTERLLMFIAGGAVVALGIALFALIQWRQRRVGEATAARDRAALAKEVGHRAEMDAVLARLETANGDLKRSNADLARLAHVASHDLKAPLRTIVHAADWLEEDLGAHFTDEMRQNMEILKSRAGRMQSFIDDLLEHARVGQVPTSAAMVPLSDLMHDVEMMAGPGEGFKINVELPQDDFLVRRMPLQQVLINLVSNALKHHDRETGRIDISVAQEGETLRITVSDDGPGIPAQYQRKIWEMFSTLQSRDKVEGSGMGLAIVLKIIETAGGEIDLASGEGRGCTFTVLWPTDAGDISLEEVA